VMMELLYSCVLIMFPMCFHMFSILNRFFMMFPRFLICSPKVFPIAPHFIPYPFANVLPFSPIVYMSQREALHPHIEFLFWESFTSFSFFFLGWQANQNDPLQTKNKKKNKKNLGGRPCNEYERALIHKPIQHPIYIYINLWVLYIPLYTYCLLPFYLVSTPTSYSIEKHGTWGEEWLGRYFK
jgi:hypothetical protein